MEVVFMARKYSAAEKRSFKKGLYAGLSAGRKKTYKRRKRR